MRYLVVPAALVRNAKDLIKNINPEAYGHSVKLIGADEPNKPSDLLLQALRDDPSPLICTVGLRPRYIQALKNAGFAVDAHLATLPGARSALQAWLLPAREVNSTPTPSAAFAEAARSPNLIICKAALERLAVIASHRYGFIHAAVTALVDMAKLGGPVGGLYAFFKARGMERKLATTGGSTYVISVRKDGILIPDLSTSFQLHLKEGDNTSPEAAVRLYFGTFSYEKKFYIAVFYCGPHLDDDVRNVFVDVR